MPFYLKHLLGVLTNIPWGHWAALCVLSLLVPVILLIRKKVSAYYAIALWLTLLIGLAIIEMAVVVRFSGIMHHGYGVDFVSGFFRIFRGGKPGRREIILNVFIFVPFGFFLSEFLASAKRFRPGRRFWIATLAGFGLSFCIESLQLLLQVGFFELTDLVMNTVGAFVGALISAGVRKVMAGRKSRVIGDGHV